MREGLQYMNVKMETFTLKKIINNNFFQGFYTKHDIFLKKKVLIISRTHNLELKVIIIFRSVKKENELPSERIQIILLLCFLLLCVAHGTMRN